jgi:hypothetical protein
MGGFRGRRLPMRHKPGKRTLICFFFFSACCTEPTTLKLWMRNLNLS